MDAVETAAVIDRATTLLAERYVFPAVGEALADLLTDRQNAGAYREAGDPGALAALVTADLQSLNGDRHLRLLHDPTAPASSTEHPAEEKLTRAARELMGGVARVQRLRGNVGLLAFAPYLLPPSLAGDTILAALRLVAHCDALVLDLRETIGGDPEVTPLICGHLFDGPTHLFTVHERDSVSRQFWTPSHVVGPRFGGDRPLAVLSSARTFSGGESLAYDLQQHGRATVVGEGTGGGAHPRIGFRVHPHLELTVPVARPVNPVSGTNWEGTGVVPDVAVPAADALDVAHAALLRRLGADGPGRERAGSGADGSDPGTRVPGARPAPVATAR